VEEWLDTSDEVVFVKAGSVIPKYPVQQYVGDWVDELTLDLYYKEGKEISL
jgi:alpha-glucosidase